MERQRAKYEALHQQKLGGRSNQGLHYNQNTQLLTGHNHTTTPDTILKAGPTIPGTTEETKKVGNQPVRPTFDRTTGKNLGPWAKISH